jgi:hypothetical protein
VGDCYDFRSLRWDETTQGYVIDPALAAEAARNPLH